MNRTSLIVFSVCLLMLGQTDRSHGDFVTFTELQEQTEAGQDFIFNFDNAPPSTGMGGTFEIRARGDYGIATPTEFVTWDIDGLGIGGTAGPTIGNVEIINDNGGNDVEWRFTTDISPMDLNAILLDGAIDILVDLNGDQTAGVGVGFQDNEFVEVTFSYTAVPEPTSFAMICGMGLALFLRRRK